MTLKISSKGFSNLSSLFKVISLAIATAMLLVSIGPSRVLGLRCYTCNPCTNNPGVLAECTNDESNCITATGRRALYEVSLRGCYADTKIPVPYECRNYTSYLLDGDTYVDVKACICGINGCNVDLPASALSHALGYFSVLGIAILACLFVVLNR
ncbi:hypothetical protein HELRODRAFT_173416 [Helobdella robusta]|uniref:UPAR/Ly6 domain-containing protein n=1 Tax=Helobdella robusta TaxID=6412 RepID=T1F6S7_HELRO|nr:hypothetical protein HELRODRAFT_173416 [Helobdella robusta]ESO03714.1 hypothetical protein HELRODRAFT_173416 [Helobdella robusta]